jgi:hypothetical protein
MTYLFLDDHHIASWSGVTRRFYQAEKEGAPILKKTEKDGGTGPYTFGWGKKTPPCTAWAADYHADGGKYKALFFTSPDGLRWNNGERVWADAMEAEQGNVQGAGYFYDESGRYAPYNYLSYVMYRNEPGIDRFHVRFRRSKDGLHYEPFPEDTAWFGPGDVICIFWDEKKRRYVAYFKIYEIRGVTKGGEPFLAHSPSFDTKRRRKSARVSGYLYPGDDIAKPAVRMDVKLRISGGDDGNDDGRDGNDDGTGLFSDDQLRIRRVIAYAESGDFLHWENRRVIIAPPENALSCEQGYGISVVPRHGMYIGMYQYFNSRSGVIDLILAWSYDGEHWSLNWDERILVTGPEGAWDHGMVFGPEFMDDGDGRMFLYYGSPGVDHTQPDGPAQIGGVGRAWLRQDGFASLSGGTVETRPLPVKAPSLALNMSGRVKIEVKSPAGEALAAGEAQGDGCGVAASIDMAPFAGREVVLSLDLTEGELYSVSL